MLPQHREIADLLRSGGGAVARRHHPELATALAWLVRTNRLHAAFPGVYVAHEAAGDLGTLMNAAMLWCSDAVVCGRAAARATFWPQISVDRLELAAPRRGPIRGVALTQRRIPPELIVERCGVRLSAPAQTALDLAPPTDGTAIDTALRSRRVTVHQLHTALAATPGRPGNRARLTLLLDSREAPWSAAERDLHRRLREARIDGWVANHPLHAHGATYYVDVAFPRERLAIEVDGRAFHGPDAFDRDRWRQNDIVLAGWRILRFSADMVRDRPEMVIASIRQALSLAA